MGRRGPQKLPTAIKKARGTFRADRVAPNELQPGVETPKQPKWLDDEAQAEWERVVPVLERLGVLAGIDQAMLADYCSVHSVAVNATIVYQREGLMVKTGLNKLILRKHPLIKVAQEARQQAMRLAMEFGLSPASRTRISAPPKKGVSADQDEEFLFGKPKLVK